MNSKRWWVVLWLSLGMVIAYTDRVNLTSAMPEIGKALHLDEEQQGMAMSAFFWTYTLGQIPAGMLVDRRGVRALYTAGILLWSISSALTVFISGLWALVTTRLVVGLGESVVTSSSLRYIREHFAEKERGFAVGVYMTGTKIGPAVGLPPSQRGLDSSGSASGVRLGDAAEQIERTSGLAKREGEHETAEGALHE